MSSFQLPPPYHIGIVVSDLDRAIGHYGSMHGIERWMRLDTDYPARHCGRDTHVQNHNAFGFAGDMMYELVEPGRGDTPASEYLATRGQGMFHLGYAVDDPTVFPPGTRPCFEVLDLDPHIVYLDTMEMFGYYLELVPRPIADQLMAAVRTVAAGGEPPVLQAPR